MNWLLLFALIAMARTLAPPPQLVVFSVRLAEGPRRLAVCCVLALTPFLLMTQPGNCLMAGASLRSWSRAIFPILGQLESYRTEWFLRDVTAGLAIAAVALPIGVAYPAIAGLPPVVGLYSRILPLVAYAIFGSSRQLIVGPDAATLTISRHRLRRYRRQGLNRKGSLFRPSSRFLLAPCACCREPFG